MLKRSLKRSKERQDTQREESGKRQSFHVRCKTRNPKQEKERVLKGQYEFKTVIAPSDYATFFSHSC